MTAWKSSKATSASPGWALNRKRGRGWRATLDLVVNSSGLTDFNPDLREALASNVAPVMHLIEFLRESDHAALMHLSTCYVVGAKDGRVVEEVQPNYTPAGIADFDAEREWQSLQEVVAHAEARAESPEITAALRRQALGKHRGSEEPAGPELDNLIRKNRMRWLRNRLTRAGTRRARRLGWPNTYTLYQSAGRIADRAARRGLADRHRAAVDRGNVHRAALPRLE